MPKTGPVDLYKQGALINPLYKGLLNLFGEENQRTQSTLPDHSAINASSKQVQRLLREKISTDAASAPETERAEDLLERLSNSNCSQPAPRCNAFELLLEAANNQEVASPLRKCWNKVCGRETRDLRLVEFRKDLSEYVCGRCSAAYRKGHYCFFCVQIYSSEEHDDGFQWIGCERCGNWVHTLCEAINGLKEVEELQRI